MKKFFYRLKSKMKCYYYFIHSFLIALAIKKTAKPWGEDL